MVLDKGHVQAGLSSYNEEEELLWTQYRVVWSRSGVVQRAFRFDIEGETVSHAIFTYLLAGPNGSAQGGSQLDNDAPDEFKRLRVTNPADNARHTKTAHVGDSDPSTFHNPAIDAGKTDKPHCAGNASANQLGRALVIVLRTQAHIFFLSGIKYIVHLPFEAEKLFAIPYGVLFQWKHQFQISSNDFQEPPAVPLNSFALSDTTFPHSLPSSQSQTLLANLAPGKDDATPILPSLSRILDQASSRTLGAYLPRIHCLVDPLAGLHVPLTQRGPRSGKGPFPGGQAASLGYDAFGHEEDILYISSIDEFHNPVSSLSKRPPCILAVTNNERSGAYTIWSVRLALQKPRSGDKPWKTPYSSGNASRRRSSFALGTSTGATTPIGRRVSNGRNSFAAARPRTNPNRENLSDESRDENAEDLRSHLDTALDSASFTARSSRRVSSLLARTDLAVNQDRGAFADIAGGQTTSNVGGRGPSFGRQSMRAGSFLGTEPLSSRVRKSHGLRSSTEPQAMSDFNSESIPEDLADDEIPSDTGESNAEPDGQTLGAELIVEKIHVLSRESLTRPSARCENCSSTIPKIFVLEPPHHTMPVSAGSRCLFLILLHQNGGSLTTLKLDIKSSTSIAGDSRHWCQSTRFAQRRLQNLQ